MKKSKIYSKLEAIYSLLAQPEFMDNQKIFKSAPSHSTTGLPTHLILYNLQTKPL